MIAATAFAGGLADALLAIHYLGILLTEVRHISPQFQVWFYCFISVEAFTHFLCNVFVSKLSIHLAAFQSENILNRVLILVYFVITSVVSSLYFVLFHVSSQ